MTTPENTRNRDPLLSLAGVLFEGDSFIPNMERDGQRQLVASDVLPTSSPWDALAALGFVKGEPRDDLFTRVVLPEGWRREGADHAMWSYVLDERGVPRVAIFYKAAFHDRTAHATLQNVGRRFATDAIYGDGAVSLPALWPVLTADERDDFRLDVEDYVREEGRRGERYRRALALLDLIPT